MPRPATSADMTQKKPKQTQSSTEKPERSTTW